MAKLILLVVALAQSAPSQAQSDLEAGFVGALKGCEEWVLNPASWAEGLGPFVARVGLGEKMGLVDRIDDAAMPPRGMRQANHYWRINSTQQAGYILVVSDRLPMCHITGGGSADLQPSVEAVIKSADFGQRWEAVADQSMGDMTSTQFKNREDPAFSIVISRPSSAGQRTDRVQLVATATYRLGI